jgi:hypothetical protein
MGYTLHFTKISTTASIWVAWVAIGALNDATFPKREAQLGRVDKRTCS